MKPIRNIVSTGASAPLTIVMVEDSEIIVDRVKEIIGLVGGVKFLGNSVSVADAIALIRKDVPDVVMIDINLGYADRMNGIDLCTIVRKVYPKIKIIILTNHSGDHYRALCKAGGADYFFDKSNDFERIPDALQEIAQRKLSG
jgi:DNA-binding NarL/FixJ family response regulator